MLRVLYIKYQKLNYIKMKIQYFYRNKLKKLNLTFQHLIIIYI